ncbi:nucleotidyltransferase domain-containing protein [Candidatus Kapabacteria bacterium]|nr:nucleotidyltransferase domain-containing protein [Candidatus Kapabacteria bacterium]
MTEKVKQTLEELILIIRSENLPLEQVYLFGAYSTGKYDASSRIDTALVFTEFEDLDIFQKYLNRLKRKIDFKLELYPFTTDSFNLDDPLAKQILKTGINIL